MIGKLKKIFNKINTMSPAAKASFWFVVSNIALKGISFITTPIFTRLMDVADYGATSVFVTWEGVISIFATLTLSGGVYKVAMTKYEDDVDSYTSSMLGLTALASVLVYTVCILINVLFPTLFEMNNAYLLYMWLQTFTSAATSFWIIRQTFNFKYKKVIAFTFVNAIGSPAIAIAAIYMFPSHKAFAKVIGSGVVGIVIGLYILVTTIRKGKTLFHKQYWIYALKFNLPLLPHYLSSIWLNSGDKLMLDNMISRESAGLYSIAHSITGVVSIVTQAINHSLIPYTLQSIKKNKLKDLYITVLGCSTLVGVICIGIVLFAKEGILIFATEEYMDAIWFVAPLAFSVLVSFVAGLIGNIIFYYEKTGHMSAISITCGVANIVLNAIGLTFFGAIAVGYTTLICSFLQMLLYYFVARKFEKNLNRIINLKFLFCIFGAFAALMIYAMFFYNSLVMKIALVVAILVLLAIFRKKIFGMFKAMKEGKNENSAREAKA